MKNYAVTFVLLSISLVAGLPGRVENDGSKLDSNADTLSYAPVSVKCPDRSQWLRPAVGVSNEEAVWIKGRKAKVATNIKSYLERLHLDDFDLNEYMKRISCDTANVPTIGLAISGGGWASAMTGTGMLRALDDKFEPSTQERTGGLLQSATYLSGLSGGAWPVMSLATYNFPSIQDMVTNWLVEQSPLGVPKDTTHRATDATIFEQLGEKFKAGYNVSFGDFLGRASSYEFVAGPNGGLGTTTSGITQLSNFKNYGMPLPMWQAAASAANDEVHLGIIFPKYNSTLYEFSPFEFGAWEGPSAFFPTEYLGTKMVDGAPASLDHCVTNFDSNAFMFALAADAWNSWWLTALSNGTYGAFTKREEDKDEQRLDRRAGGPVFPTALLNTVGAAFKKAFNYTRDEAMYATLPNPFATNISVNNEVYPPQNLTLLDESEAGQALPLWSQIQPARATDFIITWDCDEEANPYGWSDGANLHQTYVYATNRNVSFPIVPPAATFINRNFTWKPAFFGCEANSTNHGDLSAPIVLYFANYPYSSYTNFSGFQMNFTNEEMAVILTNGFNTVTQANSTLDSEWPECIACAAIDRSLARVGMPRTEQCQRCMTKHCWDGVEDNTDPGIFDPTLVLDPGLTFVEWNKSFPQTGRFWEEVEK